MSEPEDIVQCVLDVKAQSGETPLWSSQEQRLNWVDQEQPTLNRFDPITGVNEVWKMPAHCSSFALRGPGKPVSLALRTGLHDSILRPPPSACARHRLMTSPPCSSTTGAAEGRRGGALSFGWAAR
jgi:hypothetical protein